MSSPHHLDEPGAPLLFASGAPGLVVTDVDSTLITQEVIEELAEAAGTREQVSVQLNVADLSLAIAPLGLAPAQGAL